MAQIQMVFCFERINFCNFLFFLQSINIFIANNINYFGHYDFYLSKNKKNNQLKINLRKLLFEFSYGFFTFITAYPPSKSSLSCVF
ncbi:hypothetical protein [Flavobacterium branchiophilum]|uniref:hypothetical protein n=1 Tax=Flavobacterium branchiophilum TaxID=55197 RepID=UPI00105616A6|nr:hypothetical protein [Flavobacterium branchiophilum]GEM54348.1 hypothetical protein FB1_05690 [Flavobacterium branchiophilum NBRC 15030 = ATCC 35035]